MRCSRQTWTTRPKLALWLRLFFEWAAVGGRPTAQIALYSRTARLVRLNKLSCCSHEAVWQMTAGGTGSSIFCRANQVRLACQPRTIAVCRSGALSVLHRIHWRDVPTRFADCQKAHRWFSRPAKSGARERIFQDLAADLGADPAPLMRPARVPTVGHSAGKLPRSDPRHADRGQPFGLARVPAVRHVGCANRGGRRCPIRFAAHYATQ